MNANAELLNYIFQNAQMGVETLSQLIELNDNTEFKEYLSNQIQEYSQICDNAKDMLCQNGYEEKEIKTSDKVTAYLMINMKTLTDKSSKNMAKMIIEGSNKGIIDTVERINQYEDVAEKDIVKLMKKLQSFEEENIDALKKFL